MRHITEISPPVFCLLGAETPDKLSKSLAELKASGLQYQIVDGGYKGVAEKSIMVLTPNLEAFNAVAYIAKQTNQESVLAVSSTRQGYLVFAQYYDQLHNYMKVGVTLGKLKEVAKWTALQSDGYTIKDGKYYTCIKEGKPVSGHSPHIGGVRLISMSTEHALTGIVRFSKADGSKWLRLKNGAEHPRELVA